jgi:hypothetical protein
MKFKLATMILVAVTSLCLLSCGSDWSLEKQLQTQRDGDAIIVALYEHKQMYGVFPNALPADLEAQPSVGDGGWKYTVSEDGERFVLEVSDDDRYPRMWYDSRLDKWSVDI